jgi:hypothetical protein
MGAPEWVYRLTLLGWRVLRDQGEPADAEVFRPAKLTSIAYVEHDVQVAALMAQIAARAAEFVGRSGPLIDAAPFELLGPRSGTIDPRRERRAPDASATSDLAGRRVRLGRAHPGVLKPDATMVGVDRHGNRTAVMFEFDRTRRPSKQAERLQRYDWFLTVGWRESHYARLDIEPAVLFVCAESEDASTLAKSAHAQLGASIYGITGDCKAESPGREQVGFVSRASAGAQRTRVLQVPSKSCLGATSSTRTSDIELLIGCLFSKRAPRLVAA